MKPPFPPPRSRTGRPSCCLGRPLLEPLEGRQLFSTLMGGFAESQVGTSAFVSPTAMAVAPDGRIFVAEQAGQLRVIKDGQVLSQPFVTVPTDATGERGLLGIAFDPNFAANGYVYVCYTATTPEYHNRLSRFTASGDVATPGSETVIYETGPMRTTIHNGGAIHFGPDGKLYMAVGENGGPAAVQQLTSHKGKLLRMNPDGSIPADNPFVAETTGNFGAIYAIGFRNPFSFGIHPTSGRIFVNDVGTATWEEIDDVVAGGNYGYPTVEGPSNDPNYLAPFHSYAHDDGCAIVGGAFYNPPGAAQFPADFVGDYFYADLCDRYIRKIDPTTKEVVTLASNLPGRPVDVDVAADGSLYYLARPNAGSPSTQPGGVFRISFNNTGAPSIAVQPVNRTATVGQPVTFGVTASGAQPLSYQWQRNGQNIPGATGATYTLQAPTAEDNGAQFRVVVANGAGTVTSNPATLTVTTSRAPAVTIVTPAAGALYSGGDTITYSGTATDPDEGPLGASALRWRVDLHHAEHVHPFIPETTGVTGGTFTVPTTGHTESDVWLRVYLTARDKTGLETTVFTDVQPRKVTMSLGASGPGLRVTIDGQPVRSHAPGQSVTPVVGVTGIQRELAAPQTQTVNGVTYQFVSWADDPAAPRERVIGTPVADASYVANYVALDDGSQNPATSPDLTAALLARVPTAAVKGSAGRARVRVVNTGLNPAAGVVTVGLYASPDPFLDPEDTAVTSASRPLNLRPGRGAMVSVGYHYPDVVDGSYYLVASADSG